MLSASILSNYLERYYAELAGAHRYAISIMQREDGLLLARYPQPHAASDNPLGSYPLPASMIEGGVSYQRSPYDGSTRQVVTQPLTMLPWVVAVSVAESELTEAWLLSVWRTGSLTLAFCLVAVALGWVIRRQMLALSRQAAHMQYDANHDSVTGLANRRALLTAIDAQVHHEPEWMALILIDLDFFKRINDSWGHEAGDELLRETGCRLQAVADASHQVYRLGGDEFVVLVHGTALAAAELARQTQTLLARLGEPYELQHGTVMLSASAGISCFPEHADHAGDLLRLADAAMYHAKRQGRNGHVFFDRSMAQEADETLLVDTALRQAIPRQELRLLYQPVVDANNGHLGKVEALLRWRHPELGDVPPGDFIPVAEDSGMILPIGEWVLRSAVNQLRDWLDRGLPAMVSRVSPLAVLPGRTKYRFFPAAEGRSPLTRLPSPATWSAPNVKLPGAFTLSTLPPDNQRWPTVRVALERTSMALVSRALGRSRPPPSTVTLPGLTDEAAISSEPLPLFCSAPEPDKGACST